MKLPTDSTERKNTPLYSGCIAYFPLALAAVARLSKRGNDKHNPGEPMHWAREKSTDHKDCIARHLVDIDVFDEELQEYEEAAAVAWRALAVLQLLEEKRLASKPAAARVAAPLERVVARRGHRYGECILCPKSARDESNYCQLCWDLHVNNPYAL